MLRKVSRIFGIWQYFKFLHLGNKGNTFADQFQTARATAYSNIKVLKKQPVSKLSKLDISDCIQAV